MKRIGKSKKPTLRSIHNISSNLRENLEKSVFIDINTGCFYHNRVSNEEPKTEFGITVVPGYEAGKSATIYCADSWTALLDRYHKLMKGDFDV